jgi:hypothetical protein
MAIRESGLKFNMQRTWQEPWAQARHASWDQSTPNGNMFEVAAAHAQSRPPQRDANTTHRNPNANTNDARKTKRKARAEAYACTKKQKVKAEAPEAAGSRWDKTERFQPNALQPIFSATTRPLTNVERWRLRGWTWPEAMFRVDDNEEVRMESPKGTTFP